VVILQEAALGATPHRSDESALAAVAIPDCAAYRRWYMPTARRQLHHTRTSDDPVLRTMQLVQRQRKRAIEDRREIAGRYTVSQ
jgi:hypothetical protein